MNKCYIKGCANSGTEYRDRTCGPLGDFRSYCKDHIRKADLEWAVFDAERELTYAKSLVQKATSDYEKAFNKVLSAQEQLLQAKLSLIDSANQ